MIDLNPPAWHATTVRRWTCCDCILQHNGEWFASPYSFAGNVENDPGGECADCGKHTWFYLVPAEVRRVEVLASP
jgi:hypothetical protein